jgi:hypothetical protein
MGRSAQAGALETANVMAPRDMRFNDQARNDFQRQLQTAKAIGVTAVAVDVWWGIVAANGDNHWDWSYYESLFDDIERAGLHIVPVMSFHKCGGCRGHLQYSHTVMDLGRIYVRTTRAQPVRYDVQKRTGQF